jgi:hypothetical protein
VSALSLLKLARERPRPADLNQCHVVLFLVQKLVEMIVSRAHLRTLDRISDFRRQVVNPVDAALEGAKPLLWWATRCPVPIFQTARTGAG